MHPAIVKAVLIVLGFLLLPPVSSARAADCAKPPARSSFAGRTVIRNHPIVVIGFVDANEIPRDAHGVYSFNFTTTRYFNGSGPRTITITNYGNLGSDLKPGFHQPGSAREATTEFLRRNAGQNAILFLTAGDDALGKDTTGRYKEQYATNSCLYNAVGPRDYNALLPLIARIFTASDPPPTSNPSVKPTAPTDTGSLPPVASPRRKPKPDEGRSGPITRAAGLIVVVGASLALYRSPRSPLFERWRPSPERK